MGALPSFPPHLLMLASAPFPQLPSLQKEGGYGSDEELCEGSSPASITQSHHTAFTLRIPPHVSHHHRRRRRTMATRSCATASSAWATVRVSSLLAFVLQPWVYGKAPVLSFLICVCEFSRSIAPRCSLIAAQQPTLCLITSPFSQAVSIAPRCSLIADALP